MRSLPAGARTLLAAMALSVAAAAAASAKEKTVVVSPEIRVRNPTLSV